ncbi:hypothetical protein [Streptomyces himalayensis]|uniref:Uncharacterized protein n=1 Tax=Streptomyces himalayensis subsp. himalayensis TaxID=2756131 RepID=A0A7W0DJL0_9ACTN|nr:hypothetical protein [Streptomyces himalayensis]MBA2946283.1 hypothetical protein [Streptomyces himalayensis subsp. himalayensis]
MDHDSRSSHAGIRRARWESRTEIPRGVASLAYLAGYGVWVPGQSLPGPWRDALRRRHQPRLAVYAWLIQLFTREDEAR